MIRVVGDRMLTAADRLKAVLTPAPTPTPAPPDDRGASFVAGKVAAVRWTAVRVRVAAPGAFSR